MPIDQAFRVADDVLRQGVRGISDIITVSRRGHMISGAACTAPAKGVWVRFLAACNAVSSGRIGMMSRRPCSPHLVSPRACLLPGHHLQSCSISLDLVKLCAYLTGHAFGTRALPWGEGGGGGGVASSPKTVCNHIGDICSHGAEDENTHKGLSRATALLSPSCHYALQRRPSCTLTVLLYSHLCLQVPGLINVDFADVRTIMTGAGSSLMGQGRASGKSRAADAARAAVSSPLLDVGIERATGIVWNITGPEDMKLHEVGVVGSRLLPQRPLLCALLVLPGTEYGVCCFCRETVCQG